ncbi:MAG: cytochrome b [Ketobacteraceae bacterium]|nr:cytochrome b [Ketobacteraceae bacterium]
MQVRNHNAGYGLVAIVLHWLMAGLIIGMFALGLWMTDLTYYHDWYRTAPHWHKSTGVMIFFLWLLRLFWRVCNPRPQPLDTHETWEKIIASITHGLLYLLILLVIISGYMISTADGRALEVFDWFEIPAFTTGIENQEDLAGEVHFYMACVLIGVAALHAGAALKHYFFDRDSTLQRMINPSISSSSTRR